MQRHHDIHILFSLNDSAKQMSSSKPQSRQRAASSHSPLWSPDYLHAAPLHKAILSALPHLRGRLLDLGCGNAPYSNDYKVFVKDVIKADHPDSESAADCFCSAEDLPFGSESFDSLVCTQVLEHVPRPWIVAEEMHRVLRPEGVLIVSCPQYWQDHEAPHDYFRFTEYGLRQLFPENRWVWVEHSRQGGPIAIAVVALLNMLNGPKRLIQLVNFICNITLRQFGEAGKGTNTTNHVVVLRKRPFIPKLKIAD